MANNKQILIAGWFGAGNIGDDLILKVEIELLQEKYPESNITVFSQDTQYIREFYGVNAEKLPPIAWYRFYRLLNLFYTYRLFKLCSKADLFVLGGGGFFSDRQYFAIAGWLRLCRLAQWFGARVITFCIGAGPFFYERNRVLLQKKAEVFDALLVRDQQSYENFVQIGISPSKIDLCIDPVLFLPQQKREQKNQITFILFEKEEYWKKEIQAVLDNTDLDVLLVATDMGDIAFNKRLLSQFPTGRVAFMESMSMQTIVQEVSASLLIVSMRLHGNIIAASQEVPFLNVWYHFKGLEFSKRMTVEDIAFPAKEMERLDISQIILEILSKKEEYQDRIIQRKEELMPLRSHILEQL